MAGFGGLIRGGVHGHQTRGLPASAARGGAEEGRKGAAVCRGRKSQQSEIFRRWYCCEHDIIYDC